MGTEDGGPMKDMAHAAGNCWIRSDDQSGIKVFVCYRRAHDEFATQAICDKLEGELGPGSVFIDVDGSLPPGAEWPKKLSEQVALCDVLLAVITTHWLTTQGADGRRRLDGDDDFVRFEIQTALDRQITVIPVLIKDAKMPQKRDLPPVIQGLADRQAVTLRGMPDFKNDILKLIDTLKRVHQELDSARKERDHLIAAIERGDWLLPPSLSSRRPVPPELQATARYQALQELRAQAEHLASAADAISKLDFRKAAAGLAQVEACAPPIVASSRRVVDLGLRLSEIGMADEATVRAIELEFQQLTAECRACGEQVPAEREVGELLQRLLRDGGYQDAVRAYDNADFVQAATQFERLGDYRDARERLARCRQWQETLEAIRGHKWDEARKGLALLVQPEDPRARAVQKWCTFARRIVPALERLAAGQHVAAEYTLWDGRESPYVILRKPANTTIAEFKSLSYEFQERPGGMNDDQRRAYDAVRLDDRRLVIDFGVYSVSNPARVAEVLREQFAFAAGESHQHILSRIRTAVDQPSDGGRGGGRAVFDPIAPMVAELGADGGILCAVMQNYEAAIECFTTQARGEPWNGQALHHLGLAAYNKAQRNLDAADVSDTWEVVATAWAAVFASPGFWKKWAAERELVYPISDYDKVTAARGQLQRLSAEQIRAAAERDPELSDIFRLELAAARAVAAHQGIPIGAGGKERSVVGSGGAVTLQLERHVSNWVATFSPETLTRDSNERKICIAFSSLSGAQLLLDDGRFDEAIEVLKRDAAVQAATFAAANPGFAGIPGGRGPALFATVQRSLLQQAHAKAALAAVSEVPVNGVKAMQHWTEALTLGTWLHNEDAIRTEIRNVVIGRCHVLLQQKREGRFQLDALNEAVELVQDAIDRGWDGIEEGLRQTLVESLLERAVHVSSHYNMEKEARGDALRAWGLAPDSLHANLVMCTASLHYARELHSKGNVDLSLSLVHEVDERLVEAERLFPGNTDLTTLIRAAKETRALLAGDSSALDRALDALRAAADEAKTESSDSRLEQAMVFEAQGDHPRAVDLYWQLAQERPGDRESIARLSWCYRSYLLRLHERGDDTYDRVLAEAKQRCPSASALSDLVDAPLERD